MRPWPKGSPFRIDDRHGHDLARLDFGLEQARRRSYVRDAGIERRHQVQRLHHIGAVLAGQRKKVSKRIVAVAAP